MNMTARRILVLIGVLATFHLPACVISAPDRLFGRVAEPGGPENRRSIAVTLPPDAPSITQAFWSNAPGDSRNPAKNSHKGIDIVAAPGTPIISPAPGKVAMVASDPMSGKRLAIDHGPDESGAPITTWYFHLDEQLVKKDDPIERGQQIGTVGATGLLAPFPHLHFEVHRNEGTEEAVNPHVYWIDGPGKVTCFDISRAWPREPFRATYPLPCRDTPWRR
jgi:murein DD-endopeptidase MepM/ murein hydrolase activator NlpD